jgi:hypothetical protein
MRLPRCRDLPGRMKRERRTTKAAHTGSSKSICLKSHNDALRGVRLVDNAGTLQRVPTRVGARLPGKQSVFGILGGIGTHPEDVAHMKHTADLHALPNANLAYSVYVVLHETTERITQELIDSRVMGLVWCGCERAVILKDLVRCILVARVVRDDAGAACVQQLLSRPPRDLRSVPSIAFIGSAPFPHSRNRILYRSLSPNGPARYTA